MTVLDELEQTCKWTEDDISGAWDTACGEAFCFEEGGPFTNKHKFCPTCGKPIKLVPHVAPKEEEEP